MNMNTNMNMNMNMNMNIKARNETIEKFCYGTSVTEPNNMNYKQKVAMLTE